ncbi:hypothetical protein [Helcococcus sueciensis]|nr:hypothetical protein [Helcococcus sueciensis]
MEIKVEDLLEIIGDLSKENALLKVQIKALLRKQEEKGDKENEPSTN